MTSCGAGIARACAGAALLICLVTDGPGGVRAPVLARTQPSAAHAGELRALWVLRSSLASPESIAALVRSANRHGFNTLFVQVRGRGDAYYTARAEPRAIELSRQSKEFDPLARLLTAAHAARLRVHVWINVNLVSSATYLPRVREHVVVRHPEWLMVPRQLARELARMDPAKPAYVARLARWTRDHSDEVEGLYASPVPPAAVEHVRTVVREIVRGYAVDGVHFDYVRYPSERFDYSRATIREFRESVASRLPPPRRRALLARESHDLFAFPDALPDDWRQFRVSRVTTLVSRLRDVVRTERPNAVVSVAVAADVREALEGRLQDWPRWLQDGLVDAVCPMAYTTEREKFAEQITAAVAAAGERPVWAGIGAYRLTPQQTIANIATARRLGAGGIILFSYDSLVTSRQASSDYLSVVGRAAFPASPPAANSR